MKDFLDRDIQVGDAVVYHNGTTYVKGRVVSFDSVNVQIKTGIGAYYKYPEQLLIIPPTAEDCCGQTLSVGDYVRYSGDVTEGLKRGVIVEIDLIENRLKIKGDNRHFKCRPARVMKEPTK